MSSGSGTPNDVWSRRAPQQGPRPQGHRGNLNMNTPRGGMQQQPYNSRPQQNAWGKQGNVPPPSMPNPQVQSANKTNAPPSIPSPSTNAHASNASTAARPPPVNGFNRKEVEDFLQQTQSEARKSGPEGIVTVKFGPTKSGVKPGTMANGLDFISEVRKGVLAVNKVAAATGNSKETAKK
ncbi:hypothetical protein BJ508DRAFT_411117 [Ascobolus immersus RN42]|uniref:Uncharacterized protein n=1 Tax=Ascobolus immersus RN42 TaxID=1160509 RepID=A0A3N4IJR4_ASCIM|nr:hypothetical protein BJ508DRAFT_411117 [Ascobolus immersus RN42]